MESLKVFSMLTVPLIFLTNLIMRYFWRPLKAGASYNTSAFHLGRGGTRNGLKFLLVSFFILSIGTTYSYADSSGNGSCSNAEIIQEMNNITTSESHNENGAVNNNGNDYYKFTINTAGTLNIDVSTRNPDHRNYTFYVANGTCGTWNIYNGSSPSLTHSIHNINIGAGNTIYLRVHANGHKSKYRIALDFTIASTPLL